MLGIENQTFRHRSISQTGFQNTSDLLSQNNKMPQKSNIQLGCDPASFSSDYGMRYKMSSQAALQGAANSHRQML